MTAPFIPEQMRDKFGGANAYASPEAKPGALAAALPSCNFYWRLISGPARWLRKMAVTNRCDDYAWDYASAWFGDVLEECGLHIEIEGLDKLAKVNKPCVIIANHMSTLETFLLPAIVRPSGPVTFVVKKSLVEMSLFGPIMRSRDPVVVGRENPREDLATVLGEGGKRLANGISVIVFPQSTRSPSFSEEHFNSIGIKLARKAKAPVLPLALKTDAWGNGRKIKEFGKIRPDLPVRFRFGEAFEIAGPGKNEHAEVCAFISQSLSDWQKTDGVND